MNITQSWSVMHAKGVASDGVGKSASGECLKIGPLLSCQESPNAEDASLTRVKSSARASVIYDPKKGISHEPSDLGLNRQPHNQLFVGIQHHNAGARQMNIHSDILDAIYGGSFVG